MADLKDVFRTMGASNHTDKMREENDYYATDPIAAELLLDKIRLQGPIWELACGGGHLSRVFEQKGFVTRSTDLVDRGFGQAGIDFLTCDKIWQGDIVTNLPYRQADAFVRQGLNLVWDGHYVCMLLKLTFLESRGRRLLFDTYPPKWVLVFSNRLLCAKNGDFDAMRAAGGGIQAYAWFVWRKGFAGWPQIDWIN